MAGSVDNGLVPLYTVQYTTALELLLQQMGSKLRGRVREGFHVGKMASPINQVGAIALKAPAGRFTPKTRTDAEFVRRWVMPQEGSIDQLIDSFDELQTIVDPKSSYVQNAGNSVGRGWDDAIIAAAAGSATLGTDAGSLTTETFNTTNFQIAATFGSGGTASGMSVAKLLEARRIFLHYENDLDADDVTVLVGSKQDSDLLSLAQVVSTDFVEKPVLVDGKVSRFLGMNFVHTERLPFSVGGANTRGVLAFVKSGMYLGMWKELTNRVSIRNDLEGEPWDLYTSTMYGATRMQPGKVLQILCADSTGGSITP
jgi:hypothetical protein